MSFDRLHQLRPYPNFKAEDLPEEERDEADSIRSNIGWLHDRATSFWAARMLFQNCAERQFLDPAGGTIYHEWQLCAARDAVMSIYHYGRTLEGIDDALGVCPTLREMIDGTGKRAARKQFEKRFPSFIALRNALAHSAERTKTLKASRRHGRVSKRTIQLSPDIAIGLSEDAKSFVLLDNIWGTTFSSQWDGEIVKCEINDQSGVWLDKTTDAYWAAFDAIIDPEPEPPPTITVSSEPPPFWE